MVASSKWPITFVSRRLRHCLRDDKPSGIASNGRVAGRNEKLGKRILHHEFRSNDTYSGFTTFATFKTIPTSRRTNVEGCAVHVVRHAEDVYELCYAVLEAKIAHLPRRCEHVTFAPVYENGQAVKIVPRFMITCA
jgi:hypothetical protein